MVKKDVKFDEDMTSRINQVRAIILKKNSNQKLTDGQTIIKSLEYFIEQHEG